MTSKKHSPKAMVPKTKLEKAVELVLKNLEHLSNSELGDLRFFLMIEENNRRQ